MYFGILRRLRHAARMKRLEKLGTNSWFLIHDNAPAHQSVLVKDLLAKERRDDSEVNPILS